jgi:hypothetical protein
MEAKTGDGGARWVSLSRVVSLACLISSLALSRSRTLYSTHTSWVVAFDSSTRPAKAVGREGKTPPAAQTQAKQTNRNNNSTHPDAEEVGDGDARDRHHGPARVHQLRLLVVLEARGVCAKAWQ